VRLDDISVLSSQLRVVDTARNIGVVIDSQLSMSAHVAEVCRGGYYQQRQLQPLKRCVTDEAIKTLTHAFISSRLDYCNVLYCGIADGLLSRLQSVQNAAARLATGLGQREHLTPVLRQLHWLPVRQRVMFMLATLVYRSLAGTASAYQSDECHLTSSVGVYSLGSADVFRPPTPSTPAMVPTGSGPTQRATGPRRSQRTRRPRDFGLVVSH